MSVLKNVLKGVYFDRIFNRIVLSKNGITADDIDIRGRIFCYSAKKGSIRFGKKCAINSSLQSNPIGGQTKTILYTRENGSITIGDRVGISNTAIFSCDSITIGNDVMIGGDCKIYDTDFHSVEYDNRICRPDTQAKHAPILIEDGVFIGAGTMILKGVRIGMKSVIAAGSIVTKDIPPNEMWGGTSKVYSENTLIHWLLYRYTPISAFAGV